MPWWSGLLLGITVVGFAYLFALDQALSHISSGPEPKPFIPRQFGVTLAEKQHHLARWKAGIMTHREAYDYERSQGW